MTFIFAAIGGDERVAFESFFTCISVSAILPENGSFMGRSLKKK